MAAVGVYHELTSDWAVMADLKWSDWSTFRSLRVSFANPAQPSVSTDYAWRDSWFAALGARYRVDDRLAVRFGGAYDQSPSRNETRNPVIPDTDSYWAAVGFEYRFSSRLKVDFAYGHVFAKDAPMTLSAATPDNALRGNLSGNVRDSHVDYLALQIVGRF